MKTVHLTFNNTKKWRTRVVVSIITGFTLILLSIGPKHVCAEEPSKLKKQITSQSHKHCIIPDVYTIQFAGYIGLVAFGLGYSFFDNLWEISFFYGFAPEELVGVDIHTLAIKTNIYPFDFTVGRYATIFPLYIGITYFYVLDQQLHFEQSTDCPDDYYLPTGMHLTLNFGLQVLIGNPKDQFIYGFFFEMSMLDVYALTYFYEDNEQLEFKDSLTFSLGIKFLY